jgi:biotin synthase-related radical SAM superfamily protein
VRVLALQAALVRNEKDAILLSQSLHAVGLVHRHVVVIKQEAAQVGTAQDAAGADAIEQELGIELH